MDEIPKFDFSFLNKISGGDKNFIIEMVTTFKEMTPGFIENSKRYLIEKDYEGLGREAHRFLPGLSFLGIKYVEKDLSLIEEYTKKRINLEELPDLVNNTITRVEEIITIFNKEFNLE
jgi:HPt (histidine-containing phosphotransfer) domain-containing protein